MNKLLDYILRNFSSLKFFDKDGNKIYYNTRFEVENEINKTCMYIDQYYKDIKDAKWINLISDDYYSGFFMLLAFIELGYNVLLSSKDYCNKTGNYIKEVDSKIFYGRENNSNDYKKYISKKIKKSEYIGFYTSGTTGYNKNYIYDIQMLINTFDNTKKELLNKQELNGLLKEKKFFDINVLNMLPIYHIMGFMIPIIILNIGCNVININTMDIMKNLCVFKQENIYATIGVPLIYTTLEKIGKRCFSEEPLYIRKLLGDQVKIIISGGAKLKKEIKEKYLNEDFSCIIGYGLTEIGILCLGFQNLKDIDSDGEIMSCYEYKILDKYSKIKDSGFGELLVKSNDKISYELTRDLEIKNQKLFLDKYLKTGDIVKLINNKIYYLYRESSTITLDNGENISLTYIENKLNSSAEYLGKFKVVVFNNRITLVIKNDGIDINKKFLSIIETVNSSLNFSSKIKQIVKLKNTTKYTIKGEMRIDLNRIDSDEMELIKL